MEHLHNLKTMNEQQRTILRKSGKNSSRTRLISCRQVKPDIQILAEIGNVGESELGGRTLRVSRDTGCDLLTRKRSPGAAGLLRENCPTVCWFRVSCALWCPWRWRDSDVSDKTNQKLCRGRRLVRAALKLATQSFITGGIFVWEWPRGCQTWKMPEMKMFQTRFGKQLSYSDLDAFELGVRDETTNMLVRKEWTFMTNSESLHKNLNMRCSHDTKTAWRKETHPDTCFFETLSSSGATNSELHCLRERWCHVSSNSFGDWNPTSARCHRTALAFCHLRVQSLPASASRTAHRTVSKLEPALA